MKTVRDFAERVVHSNDLGEKLAPPPRDLIDDPRGDRSVPGEPGRHSDLRIVAAKDAKVPPLAGWADPLQRRRIVHALANHELQCIVLPHWVVTATEACVHVVVSSVV